MWALWLRPKITAVSGRRIEQYAEFKFAPVTACQVSLNSKSVAEDRTLANTTSLRKSLELVPDGACPPH